MEVDRGIIAGIRPHEVHPITETTQPGGLRRSVAELGRSLGLDDEALGRASIVATELGTNLVKHATGGGEVLFRPMVYNNASGIELISIDRGPGMANPERMQMDGVSTSGSQGTGLGAMRRLSDEFALYSSKGVGTAVLSRIWAGRPYDRVWKPSFQWGVVNLPIPGEEMSGDGWGILLGKGRAQVMVVDGLGHGEGAALAAHEAIRAFTESGDLSAVDAIKKLHVRLRSTRGAAVAVASISVKESRVKYVGVGNIYGRIVRLGEPSSSLVTMNGTVGHQTPKIKEFLYPWEMNSMLIMNSDGFLSNWDLAAFPGLLQYHPALVAAMVYREYHRGTDDAAVLAIRLAGSVRA